VVTDAASCGALVESSLEACCNVSIDFILTSPGLTPLNLLRKPSWTRLRPSDVSKSATMALISSPDLGSLLAVASALALAMPSFSRPQRPLGSAAVTAMPLDITLSIKICHSSGVNVVLFAMGGLPTKKAALPAERGLKSDRCLFVGGGRPFLL